MPRPVHTCFLACLLAILGVESTQAVTAGLGITGIALTKPNHGDATYGAVTDLSVELLVNRRVSIGITYSGYDVEYDEDYDGPGESYGGGPDERVLSIYVSTEFLFASPLATYFKVGGGSYTMEDGFQSNSAIGVFAAIGERLYVMWHLSFSLEVQYHLVGTVEGYPPTDDLLRVLLNVEAWTSDRR